MGKRKGSFECFNPHCPYYLQLHKCNRRQFTPAGACKSCGQFSERGTCEARKIWEFPGQWVEKIVTVKHYGTHSCSPIKQIKGDKILGEISANPNKVAKARRDILFSMRKEGADYEYVADKASKLMGRSALNRAKLVKNGSEVSDLLKLKEKYSKNDKFLLYKMNDRALNNNPSFIFKTSLTALEIASQ